ncbi:unnamed protein product [Caenorhabditis sp. 36 PRJEB53466]|nr:unnamed protein product [Caenorhabditis sp. 36 PRJEB53466]
MASITNADLSKVSFNPSTSVTFLPVEKKQMATIEVTNGCNCDVAIKWKNTGPKRYKTIPAIIKTAPGEKMTFKCYFKGLEPEVIVKDATKDRFTIVYAAVPKNAVLDKVFERQNVKKFKTQKKKILIFFQGINDKPKEGETQQPTGNDEEEDKDRQGQLRQKPKSEVKTASAPAPVAQPQAKKATVVMFMRKEGESLSDEDDEKEDDGTVPAAAPVAAGDEMQTTRLAVDFKGQQAPNAAPGTPVTPGDDLKTTRPAGTFAAQATPNAPGTRADPKSDLKTTRPAGTFDNAQKPNK